MKAMMEDAPYRVRQKRERKAIWIVAGLIGTGVTAAMLFIASEHTRERKPANAATHLIKTPTQPKEPQFISEKDWDKIVEEAAKRGHKVEVVDVMTEEEAKREIQAAQEKRATEAIRIVNAKNFGEGVVEQPKPKAARTKPKEIVVVGTERRISDFCGGGEGSITRRNCKANVELQTRN